MQQIGDCLKDWEIFQSSPTIVSKIRKTRLQEIFTLFISFKIHTRKSLIYNFPNCQNVYNSRLDRSHEKNELIIKLKR